MSQLPHRPFRDLNPPVVPVIHIPHQRTRLIKVIHGAGTRPVPSAPPDHLQLVALKKVPAKQISLLKPLVAPKRKLPESSTATQVVPKPTAAPVTTNKLFILKNGELKSIKKSNISSSGIIKFIPEESNARPILRPLSSSYILNNDIQGGVMTMDQYRNQVDVHRKNQILERATKAAAALDPVTIYKMIRPNDLDLETTQAMAAAGLQPVPPRNKPGRKKGMTCKKVENVSSLLEPVPSGARTRSGRVSRPPRHIQRFYTDTAAGVKESIYLEDETVEEIPLVKKQRRVIGGERLKCDQCGKSYANERMLNHHVQVAHEMCVGGDGHLDNDNLRIDCFNFLLGRLKKVPIKLRGKVFLDEMEIFVNKMHKLMEKLIRRKTEGFLNYSQVHQVPKVLEAVLNVPAGQYHFDTQVIDGDEKTILSHGTAAEKEDEGNGTISNAGVSVVRENESALSGFDDSSTQPTMVNLDNTSIVGGDPENNDDNATKSTTKEATFADHIISLEDAIYGPPLPVSSAPEDYLRDDEDYEDEEDDLTTPKKEPQPSQSTRRLKKLKRVIKNLNKCNSEQEGRVPLEAAASPAMSHGEAIGAAGAPLINRPVIKDLSMELFRSPDISASRRSGGDVVARGGANSLPDSR